MPEIVIVRIFTLYQYFLLNSDCFHGNIYIEINMTDWSLIEITFLKKDTLKIFFFNMHINMYAT